MFLSFQLVLISLMFVQVSDRFGFNKLFDDIKRGGDVMIDRIWNHDLNRLQTRPRVQDGSVRIWATLAFLIRGGSGDASSIFIYKSNNLECVDSRLEI